MKNKSEKSRLIVNAGKESREMKDTLNPESLVICPSDTTVAS